MREIEEYLRRKLVYDNITDRFHIFEVKDAVYRIDDVDNDRRRINKTFGG